MGRKSRKERNRIKWMRLKKWNPNITKCTIFHRRASFFVKKVYCTRVYTVCTRINYRIVPVTSLNKYLEHGTSKKKGKVIPLQARCGPEGG